MVSAAPAELPSSSAAAPAPPTAPEASREAILEPMEPVALPASLDEPRAASFASPPEALPASAPPSSAASAASAAASPLPLVAAALGRLELAATIVPLPPAAASSAARAAARADAVLLPAELPCAAFVGCPAPLLLPLLVLRPWAEASMATAAPVLAASHCAPCWRTACGDAHRHLVREPHEKPDCGEKTLCTARPERRACCVPPLLTLPLREITTII